MALFSFTNPALTGRPEQVMAQGYNQQRPSLLNPGQAQLEQSNPIASEGMQSLSQAFQQSQQQGTPAQQGMPQDADAYLAAKGITPQSLAQGLMQQPQQNWWDRITTEATYPKPFAGGRSY